MAQARRTLSPKRVLEKLRQHRACVLTLAHQSAQRPVRAKLRAQGVKLYDVSYAICASKPRLTSTPIATS